MMCEFPGDGSEFRESIGYKDNLWWTGLVWDQAPRTGEERLRLMRAVRNQSGWQSKQTWRLRPDYWSAEAEAVAKVQNGGGRTDPPATPTDPTINVKRYLEVRRDGTRWVAAVRAFNENKGRTQTRLYHWDPDAWARRQCWTVGPTWKKVKPLAARRVG